MNKIIVALVSIAHLVPHPFGVSPIGATAMYAGAYAPRHTAWLTPLVPLFVGHLLTGFYDPTVMLFVYAGFALSTFSGQLLTAKRNASRFSLAVIAGAVIFYIVSNFSVWLVGMYPPTASGLLQCYLQGLPYLATSIAANAVYGVLIFSLHSYTEKDQFRAAPA